MEDSATLADLQERMARIEDKVDKILEALDGTLKTNCDKMGEHIDFVERVYDNVKNPLGYICSKVGYVSGTTQYSLEAAPTDSGVTTEEDYNAL